MRIYNKLSDLPDYLQEKYRDWIKKFTPLPRFEYILHVGKLVWASDVHIIPVSYDKDTKDTLVKIKYRIDGDLGNYIYNLWNEFHDDIRSYITMEEYKDFVYAIKDYLNLKANNTFVPWDEKHIFDIINDEGDVTGSLKLRVNIMPTGIEIVDLTDNKNKITLWYHPCITSRIIDDKITNLPTLDQLELIPSIKQKLLEFLKWWNWSLIVSWPTWSGKSVLNQILLWIISNEEIKISTLEDPIEYINPFLVQTQIAKNKWFDWVDGLMALMRQDPDVIMVWEIRNEEVAKLALEISATGHMLFSTTHAKSWAWTYDRFRQMGIPNYIISWITVSVWARLSKRLCSHCKMKVESEIEKNQLSNIYDNFFHDFDFTDFKSEDLCFFIWDNELKYLSQFDKYLQELRFLKKNISLSSDNNTLLATQNKIKNINNSLHNWIKDYFINNSFKRNPKGCEHCLFKGTKWRIWVQEFIFMTKDLEKLILDNKPQKHIENYLRKENLITLERNWIIRMMRWCIDYQELLHLNVNND